MCHGTSSAFDQQRPAKSASLVALSREEADKHKWIESEKLGRDVGLQAIREWCDKYWDPFMRARVVEHVLGQIEWTELRLQAFEFGALVRLSDSSCLSEICNVFRGGGPDAENLRILLLAQIKSWEREEVFVILEALRINNLRKPCQLMMEFLRELGI